MPRSDPPDAPRPDRGGKPRSGRGSGGAPPSRAGGSARAASGVGGAPRGGGVGRTGGGPRARGASGTGSTSTPRTTKPRAGGAGRAAGAARSSGKDGRAASRNARPAGAGARGASGAFGAGGERPKPLARGETERGARVRPPLPEKTAGRRWGSVARKGALVLDEAADGTASAAWRAAVQRAAPPAARPPAAGRPPAKDAAASEDTAPAASPGARQAERQPTAFPRAARARRSLDDRKRALDGRGGSGPARARRRERRLPEEVGAELASTAGPARAARLGQRLAEATRDYERDRYQDALRILKALAGIAPAAPAVRELYGLTLYRLGRWRDAVRELAAFHQLTGSFDQHPVLADCRRALRQYRQVDQLWSDLREASPSPEVMAEGRLVVAGSLADRNELGAAITMLERHARALSRPRLHHLRTWYALGDLYERAGDLPRARQLFRRVVGHDPELFDAAERL